MFSKTVRGREGDAGYDGKYPRPSLYQPQNGMQEVLGRFKLNECPRDKADFRQHLLGLVGVVAQIDCAGWAWWV